MKKIFVLVFIGAFLFNCGGGQTESKEKVEESSKQWLTFKGEANAPSIVLVSGDEEYRSEAALPQLAKILSTRHGFNCTVLFAQDPEMPGVINPNYLNNIPGLEQLDNADLMVIFTRFRALPDDQMSHIDQFLKDGKPVIGIRTSTHAFDYRKVDFESAYTHYSTFYDGDDEWKGGFGRLILGEKWIAHHGHHKHQSTRGIPAPGAENHPILNGIEPGTIWGPSDVYTVRLPLPGDSQPIVMGEAINRAGEFDENDPLFGMRPTDDEVAGTVEKKKRDGTVIDFNPNDPMMPIAWIKSYQIPGGKEGKAFTSTIGAATDLISEGTRRMMVNAVYWSLDKEVPEKADVETVGDYQPRSYAFLEAQYWIDNKVEVSSLE